jgi:hypothetical protein
MNSSQVANNFLRRGHDFLQVGAHHHGDELPHSKVSGMRFERVFTPLMRLPPIACLQMHERELNVRGMPDSCAWARILGRYRESSCARGVFELVITAVPFVLLWILMWTTLATGYWIFATGGAVSFAPGCPLPRLLIAL